MWVLSGHPPPLFLSPPLRKGLTMQFAHGREKIAYNQNNLNCVYKNIPTKFIVYPLNFEHTVGGAQKVARLQHAPPPLNGQRPLKKHFMLLDVL